MTVGLLSGLITLPVAFVALIASASPTSSCDSSMETYLLVCGFGLGVFALVSAFDVYMAEAGRSVTRTLHAVQLDPTLPLALSAASAAKTWVSVMRAPVAFLHLLRETLKAGIALAVLAGLYLLNRCGDSQDPSDTTSDHVTNGVMLVIGYCAAACTFHGLVEAVSALKIGPYWHTDVHMGVLAKSLVKAAKVAGETRDPEDHQLKENARDLDIIFADEQDGYAAPHHQTQNDTEGDDQDDQEEDDGGNGVGTGGSPTSRQGVLGVLSAAVQAVQSSVVKGSSSRRARVESDDTSMIGMAHTFVPSTAKGVTFCNVCSRSIRGIGSSGLECSCCGYLVHKKCQGEADQRCKVYVSMSSLPPVVQSKVMQREEHATGVTDRPHLWVRGNCPGAVPSTCLVCYKSTTSSRALVHYRCAWCQATVHDACRDQAPVGCTYGIHAPLIVPPEAVELEDVSGANGSGDGPDLRYVFRPVVGTRPLLVFINPKAGGRQGEALFPVFQQLLNPAQVFDLMACRGPMQGLVAMRNVANFIIVCCGGDGTVGWIMQELDKVEFPGGYQPPIAVIPLGTGNDLARSLGWGGGYEGEDIHDILVELAAGKIYPMDRWQLRITGAEGSGEDPSEAGEVSSHNKVSVLNNYFSIGLDSKLALKFHTAREANPGKFSSRLYNKYYYGKVGAKQLLCGCGEVSLSSVISVQVDGAEIDLGSAQGICILNLPSYAAGCDFWGKPSSSTGFSVAAVDDKMLEVVTISSTFHLSRCTSKKRFIGSPKRVAQGAVVTITRLPDAPPLPMQVDGEPWAQEFTSLTIDHLNQARMLTHPVRSIVNAKEVAISEGANILPHIATSPSSSSRHLQAQGEGQTQGEGQGEGQGDDEGMDEERARARENDSYESYVSEVDEGDLQHPQTRA